MTVLFLSSIIRFGTLIRPSPDHAKTTAQRPLQADGSAHWRQCGGAQQRVAAVRQEGRGRTAPAAAERIR
ncbi:hypothetical protein VARIO8X_100115 [Burkholderiales bacterium 8X]|nr:hypothetical protein VARIO8X_100115 [Burkholderiales bacterium 8X]